MLKKAEEEAGMRWVELSWEVEKKQKEVKTEYEKINLFHLFKQ